MTATQARACGWVALCGAAVAVPFLVAPYQAFQATTAAAYVPVIAGLVLLTGVGGQVSLGQGALFGLGAYTAALLMERLGWPFAGALVGAVIATGALGLVIGLPALRLHGMQLALVTLALAVVFTPLVLRFDDLSGGTAGLALASPEAPAWTGLAADQWVYLVGLAVAAAALVLVAVLMRGRLGLALRAVHTNELSAAAAGVDVAATKAAAFGVAAGLAGAGGALYAWSVAFVSADSFPLLLSVTFLVGMVVGGSTSVLGAVLGALFVQFGPEGASGLDPDLGAVIYGAAVIAVLLLAPGGLSSIAARVLRQPSNERRAT